MATTETHFPPSKPRARLRSSPLPCPLTGELLVGAQCLGRRCPYASEAHGFCDCELIDHEEDAGR